jgi:Cu-Zn family superoxide dismutase
VDEVMVGRPCKKLAACIEALSRLGVPYARAAWSLLGVGASLALGGPNMKTPMNTKLAAGMLCGALLFASACEGVAPSPTDDDEHSLAPPVQGPPPQQSAADQHTEIQREEAQPPTAPPSPEGSDRSAGERAAKGTEPGSVGGANAGGARAIAELAALDDAELRAKITLEQRTDGVQVLAHLENAKPGPRSLRVLDADDCGAMKQGNVGKPLAATLQHGELGNFEVGKDGKGSLSITAAKASLQTSAEASLVGKVIVLQERSLAGDVTGRPLACGVVELEQDHAAGKSGRASPTTAMR